MKNLNFYDFYFAKINIVLSVSSIINNKYGYMVMITYERSVPKSFAKFNILNWKVENWKRVLFNHGFTKKIGVTKKIVIQTCRE